MTTSPYSPTVVDDEEYDDLYTEGVGIPSEMEDDSLQCPNCGMYCLEPVGNCFQCDACYGFFTEDDLEFC